MKRDTDGDGVRDGVELGKTSVFFIGQGTPNETFGSWTERLARYGTPFKYDFIPNYDADPASTTSPTQTDSDSDGLPDGWIDGWTYQSSPVDPRSQRTYSDSQSLTRLESRYDPGRWLNGGSPDNLVQVYELRTPAGVRSFPDFALPPPSSEIREGEDLNCDGAQPASGSWNFTNDTKERTGAFMETDPTSASSEPGGIEPDDGIPDGYEVWYSSMTDPIKMQNGSLFFSPLTGDEYRDNDTYNTIASQPDTSTTAGPSWIGPDNTHMAIAQRMWFGTNSVFGPASNITKVKQIQLQLNMSLGTDLKVTLELWDSSDLPGFSI